MGASFFSLWAFVFRKKQIIANVIDLNCLAPYLKVYQDTVLLRLRSHMDKTIDQLKLMISKRWPSLFENILPTDFILCKIDSGVVISIRDQISQYNNGQGQNDEEIFLYKLC